MPFEKGLRTCVAASAAASALRLDTAQRRAVFHAALLRSIGCTAHGRLMGELHAAALLHDLSRTAVSSYQARSSRVSARRIAYAVRSCEFSCLHEPSHRAAADESAADPKWQGDLPPSPRLR